MTFVVSVTGHKEELAERLREKFADSYPDPVAPGVHEMFGIGVDCVNEFVTSTEDEGNFSASVSGHTRQRLEDRDSLTVLINAIDEEA
jgi:hypothetical protein